MIKVSVPSSAVPARVLVPRIYWAGDESDLERFPHRWELERRCGGPLGETPRLKLHAFADALARATARVWVLDPFFDDDAVRVLKEGIARSWNYSKLGIRILSKSGGAPAVILDASVSKKQPRVEWLPVPDKHFYPYVHDRFCIVDDELFHCGGTVGGAMRRLTAASAGWSAQETRAVEFYEELWNAIEARR